MDDTKLVGAPSRGLAEQVVLFNGECWITFDILCGDLQNYQSPIENWSENLRPFAILTGCLAKVLTGFKLHKWALLES